LHLDEAKAILDSLTLDNVDDQPKATTSQQQPSSSSVLTLRGSSGTIHNWMYM
jgi:hypothetical protein